MGNSMTVGLENAVEIVGCHAEGEVGDVIIGGVEPPPGETRANLARIGRGDWGRPGVYAEWLPVHGRQ